MKKCPKCGADNPDNAKECSSCVALLDQGDEGKRRLGRISFAFLIVDIMALFLCTAHNLTAGRQLLQLADRMKATIPMTTRIILSSYYGFFVLAVILIAKEWSSRKEVTLIANIVALFLLVIYFGVYSIVSSSPLFEALVHMK